MNKIKFNIATDMSKKFDRKIRDDQKEKEIESKDLKINRNTKSRMHLQTDNSQSIYHAINRPHLSESEHNKIASNQHITSDNYLN